MVFFNGKHIRGKRSDSALNARRPSQSRLAVDVRLRARSITRAANTYGLLSPFNAHAFSHKLRTRDIPRVSWRVQY